MPSSFTFRVLGTPVPQGSVKATAVELLPTIERPSAVGALMLHLQHIVQGQTTGTNQLQFHCAVSLFSLAQSLISALAATPVSSKSFCA